MIKFFRRIRQQLLSQNRFSKYLIYAVGEIVLVVIGILIALSINNWNENRKERQEETAILTALEADLIESKKRLNSTLKQQNKVIKNNALMLDILEHKVDVNEHLDSIGEIFNWGFLVFHRAEPVTGAYDAMTGAGKTALIQNQDLSRLLAEYFTEIKMGYEDHEYGMIVTQLVLDRTASYNGPLHVQNRRNLGRSKEILEATDRLVNDQSLLGLLARKSGIEWRRRSRQKKLLSYVDELLELIKLELDD